MKALIFYLCILALASFSLAVKQELRKAMKNRVSSAQICMNEHNMLPDEWYTEEEIVLNQHTESANAERSRKVGCVAECNLKRNELLNGRDFNEEKLLGTIDEMWAENEAIRQAAHNMMSNCFKQVKDITEECNKGLGLYVCVIKAIHELEDHDEHVVED